MMGLQKILPTVTFVCCSALSLHAQIDFTKYFDETSIPLVDIHDHLDLDFKWDMAGGIQVFMNEGINFLKEGDPNLAATNFDEVIKRDSLSWIAFYYRGICYKNLGRFEEARKDLLHAKSINPKHPAVYVELGELYHIQNVFNNATDEYEKAIELDPHLVQA